MPPGVVLVSSGYTGLVEGSARAWQRALPDPDARKALVGFAAQAAGGIVAEMARGASPFGAECRDDLFGVVQIAGVLGVGNSSDEEDVRAFVSAAVATAKEALEGRDDGIAWERVTTALLRKTALTGDDVRAIVREADAEQEDASEGR
jgi:hypothetical protein